MSYDSDSECDWVDLSRTGELDGFLSDGWSTAERCSNAESATMLSSLSRVPSSLSVFSEASAAGTPKQNKGAYFRNRQPPCGSGQTCVSYCFHEYLTGWSCGSYANCAECSE